MRRVIHVVALAGALACGKPSTTSQAACVPADCVALGATCGAVGDGCGGVLQCGACDAGETCGGGGKANVCGRGTCRPATCEAMHATCGSVSDGCGATLSCGDCAAGDGCGAGGAPNVCAPLPPTGDVRWAHVVSTPGPDFAVGVGNDVAGNRYLLTFTWDEVGTSHTLRLEKLGPDGKLAWDKEWTAEGFTPDGFRMVVAPAGSIYVAASAGCAPWDLTCHRSLDLGGGAATDSVLVRLAPDGSFEWQRELTGADVIALAANEQGNAIVVNVLRGSGPGGPSGVQLEKFRSDGALLAALDGVGGAVALDPSGNMIVVTPNVVTKYSASGVLQWSAAVPGAGQPTAVETTAQGTIVVLSFRTGDVAFGSSRVTSGSQVVLVLEPDGRPRFARGTSGFSAFLAVDPTGRAAVATNGICGEVVVEAFDLSNADLWRRPLADDAVSCTAGMLAGGLAYGADHRLFVTGAFSQTVVVGGKTLTPRSQDAIGALLGP